MLVVARIMIRVTAPTKNEFPDIKTDKSDSVSVCKKESLTNTTFITGFGIFSKRV